MATQNASTVLALFDTRMDVITSETPDAGFKKSPYRFMLAKEPDSAIDGLYFVDIASIEPHNRTFGATETIWNLTATVEVGYFRGGGDLDGGDRQSTTRNAANDVMRIADVIQNSSGYDGANSGVREIRFLGASRTVDKPASEVWEVRFFVQWRSDVVTV